MPRVSDASTSAVYVYSCPAAGLGEEGMGLQVRTEGKRVRR